MTCKSRKPVRTASGQFPNKFDLCNHLADRRLHGKNALNRVSSKRTGKNGEPVYAAGTPDGKVRPRSLWSSTEKGQRLSEKARSLRRTRRRKSLAISLATTSGTSKRLDPVWQQAGWLNNSPVDFINGSRGLNRDARSAKASPEFVKKLPISNCPRPS